MCSSRIFVQEGIYDEFVNKIAIYSKGFTAGDPFEPSTIHGPQVTKKFNPVQITYQNIMLLLAMLKLVLIG